jgi:3-hydroxyacyl-[acyl-carrier-protein] dehydratase
MVAFMAADRTTMDLILKAVPQQDPFRFIDEILELDEEHITGAYRFREDEYFYRGHFPGHPVTPGVMLIEAMAQTGVVAFGIYLAMAQWNLSFTEINGMMTLFTHAENVEFTGIVHPGERVIIRGQKIYLRKRNLKSKISMERECGEEVCSGILAGMAVHPDAVPIRKP